MSGRVEHVLVDVGLGVLYLLPLALLLWGFRSRRRWRQARGLEASKPAAAALRPAAPPRAGFHVEARQVALVYGCYVLLLAMAVAARRYWLALLPHLLYLALLGVTWWSALSPRQYAFERSRDPQLTRSDYITALIGSFGVMPLAAWLALGLPALRTTVDLMRGH